MKATLKNMLDEECRYQKIKINLLNVGKYQRGEASKSSTQEKVLNFSFSAMAACVVGMREDGTLWLVDGLQRKLAAEKRGDIESLDCMVFQSRGESHEAEVFLLCNKGRINVDALHKFRTAAIAGREPESSISTWLGERGLAMSNESSQNRLSFPIRFLQLWKSNEDVCKKSILITCKICNGQPNCDIFTGINYLIKKGIDVESQIEKLQSIGGKTRILQEINSVAILTGQSKNWKACATGVLNCINYKKKNKITFFEESNNKFNQEESKC